MSKMHQKFKNYEQKYIWLKKNYKLSKNSKI